MVMTFISFIHSFSFTVIYSFTCQLTHIFTLQAYAKKALHAGSKKQVYEVEEGAAPFFSCPPLCSPFPHPWDQRMTLVALSKDIAHLLLPSLASIILPSLLSRSEPSSPSALDSSRVCRGFTPFDIPGKYHARVQSHLSCVQLCASLWTVAPQAPLFTGLSRQGSWNGLPCPPNTGIEPTSLTSPVLAGKFFATSKIQCFNQSQMDV